MAPALTSVKNPRIQRIRALQSSPKERRKAGVFVAEGVRLLEEALAAGWKPEMLLAVEELPPRAARLVEAYRARGVAPLWVTPRVLAAASDTRTPQGLLAVFPKRSLPLKKTPDFLLLLDGIRDPGNLGTILRTALAAGVDGILLPPENTDPYAPKVVRSAMGAHFRLPLVQAGWERIPALLRGLPVYLSEARRGLPYTQADFRAPCALLIGGEAAGASPAARRLAAESIHIPMPGPVESLNAAVAAAVLMFEVVRQRGATG